MEIFLKFALAILGLLLYIVIKAKDYVFGKEPFSMEYLVQDNIKAFLWSFILVSIILTMIAIEPEVATLVKTATGIDVQFTTVGAATLALNIIALTRNASK